MLHQEHPRADLRQRLPDTVRASWDRSRRYGISPSDALLLNEVTLAHQKRVRERNQRLAGYAAPELAALHRALGGAGWMLACLDEEGTIAATYGKAPSPAARLDMVLRTGVSLSELTIGTNGPGCAIAERKPVVVSGCEHYLQEAKDFICVAVPVFDPSGELVGAIDASSTNRSDGGIALGGLTLAAHAIEKRMMADLRDAIFIRMHARPDMLGTPLEALLAVSPDGCLLGLNQAARHMLALPAGAGGDLAFATLFDTPFHLAMDRLGGACNGPVQLQSAGGLLLHARIGMDAAATPPAPRAGARPAAVQDTNDMKDTRVEQQLHYGRRAYARNIPVLLTGETGTGKEVAARLLHDTGPRAGGPFIAVNCSAIPASLIESEFFGYVEGAFTGGRSGGAPGKMEQAHGGTLFLDEIGDMPVELQGRLLRVLQERSITRLGGGKPVAIDIAVVCATHRDLPRLVADGAFREDLLYRINGFQVRLPALRERDDFAALAQRVLRDACAAIDVLRISGPAMAALQAYAWPGNIRQLQHVLRVAALYAEETGRIEPAHLPPEVTAGGQCPGAPGGEPVAALTHFKQNESAFIRGALHDTGGNISATAQRIGISRHTLYRKMRQYGIARPGGE
ncbi:sigma-54-dependent Fis family transcriptional regulator [Duganella sp. FT92W]|uniref:Sigma-54-dependent Fis family transcriptional regulator n=1 Tax=Pseudoduganella rivuli TaxID=2666085 RepID=A0A7X2IKY3_9BURK|nr:sigma-54-dependent Fis family transcriptional regulator [Pseudoduganella rivuli]MRV71756.1 sigma-54-dependent Fis family transcriptional regulator [Pseudoduganella rivuli]